MVTHGYGGEVNIIVTRQIDGLDLDQVALPASIVSSNEIMILIAEKHPDLRKNMLKKLSAVTAVLFAAGIAAYLLAPLLLPKEYLTVLPDSGCDMQQQPCSAILPGGGNLQLSISPRPIPLLKPLQVEVSLSGITPHKVEIDFAGARMSMGPNHTELAAGGTGSYVGQTSLPVCVSGGMEWIATVIVETDRMHIAVPYRFVVGH
jgi:hypothetical protein